VHGSIGEVKVGIGELGAAGSTRKNSNLASEYPALLLLSQLTSAPSTAKVMNRCVVASGIGVLGLVANST
jgi:hypothetical protein